MIRRLQPNTQYRIGVYGSVLRDEIKFDGPEGFETGRTGKMLQSLKLLFLYLIT